MAKWKPVGWEIMSVTKLNGDEDASIIPELVSSDLRKTTYHPSIMTACIVPKSERSMTLVNGTQDWKELSDDAILGEYARDGSDYEYTRDSLADYLQAHSDWSPCSIIREEESGVYTVRLATRGSNKNESGWYPNDRSPDFLTKYPRRSIRYYVKPYESDLHLPNAFRHHIDIRDDIFPDKWKDRPANKRTKAFARLFKWVAFKFRRSKSGSAGK